MLCFFKWTESLIARDPKCKDGDARFTTVPFKALSDESELNIHVLVSLIALFDLQVL